VIGIVDYGAGNLRSVCKAVEAVGHACHITANPDEIDTFSGLILPGVGAFTKAMDRLRALSLIEPVTRFIESGRPFLGICLGMQVLMDESEEVVPGAHSRGERLASAGLGVVHGRVSRFRGELKVPQIGWNSVSFERDQAPLFRGLSSGAFFYFVHSYHVVPDDGAVVTCRSSYGVDFCAALHVGNVYGVQFHPEKSGSNGLTVLRNFGELVRQ
jgi:glutamine amidotransferase